MTIASPARRPRRWRQVLGASMALALALLAAVPWLLGTAPARSRVAARINAALAPGRLEFAALRLSWFGPTRLTEVALLDPAGRRVASVRSAKLDRSLGGLLLGARGPATLTLHGASLDVHRSAGGSIDLAEALRTIIATPDPERDLTVRIAGGSLRFADPSLAGPMAADPFDLDLRVRPAPDPVSWTMKLAQGASTLETQGIYDQWPAKGGAPRSPEIRVGVVSKGWPIATRSAGLDVAGRLDGTLDFLRAGGRWKSSGDVRLLGLRVDGALLAGDTLAMEQLDAGWDLARGDEGWSIRRLTASGPLGELKAEGPIAGAGPGLGRIAGRLDLAAIARQLPHALRLRDGLTVEGGMARLSVGLDRAGERTTIDVEARVADLAARHRDRTFALRDPATFTAKIAHDGRATTLEQLAVKTSFLDASARGKLEDGVDLQARIDLDALRRQLGDWVDLGDLTMDGVASVTGKYEFSPREGPDAHSRRLAEARARGQSLPDERSLADPRYTLTLAAPSRNLGIGKGSLVIVRDPQELRLAVTGPALAWGAPGGWDRISAGARSVDASRNLSLGEVSLESKAGAVDVLVTVRQPLERAAQLDRNILLSGRWAGDGRALTIHQFRFVLGPKWSGDGIPPGPETQLPFAAQGRLDLSTGELALDAIPGADLAAIAPGPDGIRVSGIGGDLAALRFRVSLTADAGLVDSRASGWMERPPLGLSGRWSAVASARSDADGVQLSGKLGPDSPPSGPALPPSMAFAAHYSPEADRVDLTGFTASTGYGTLDASGRIDDPGGLRRVDLRGTLAPDFDRINALLADRVEPGARVAGRPRPFRFSGSIGGSDGDRLRGLDAELGLDLTGADIYGMQFGPTPVVLRARGGRLSIDPIDTTLNEGRIRLEPEFDLDAPGGPLLKLVGNSAIREARINDEVSRRVLAYVAPILDQATRASGLVSVDLDRAEFPIGAGRGRQARVEGAVVFKDVEFAPGPLADELLRTVGRREVRLRLDQPVTLTVADGRINQRGMSVPVGNLTRIGLAGWVDFDRNLSLTASLPVTPAMLGNNPMLADIVAGTVVEVPIRGTLGHPTVDKDAFQAGLRDAGKSLLTRGATRGALELLMRMSRPRDPDAPPPPPRLTPGERKALRMERRAERRGEIPPPARPEPLP